MSRAPALNRRRRPLRGMVPDELDQLPRRRAFQEAHPGAEFCHPGGMAQVHVPWGSGSITVTRETLREALDAAGEMLPEAPDSG